MSKNFNLVQACKNNDIIKVKTLLKESDVNVNCRFHMNTQSDMLWKSTPLIEAIKNKNLELVKLLIENKADVKEKTTTPLYYALNSSQKIAKYLIDCKANVNCHVWKSRSSLLKILKEEENYEAIKLLIKEGVNIPRLYYNIPKIMELALAHSPHSWYIKLDNAVKNKNLKAIKRVLEFHKTKEPDESVLAKIYHIALNQDDYTFTEKIMKYTNFNVNNFQVQHYGVLMVEQNKRERLEYIFTNLPSVKMILDLMLYTSIIYKNYNLIPMIMKKGANAFFWTGLATRTNIFLSVLNKDDIRAIKLILNNAGYIENTLGIYMKRCIIQNSYDIAYLLLNKYNFSVDGINVEQLFMFFIKNDCLTSLRKLISLGIQPTRTTSCKTYRLRKRDIFRYLVEYCNCEYKPKFYKRVLRERSHKREALLENEILRRDRDVINKILEY